MKREQIIEVLEKYDIDEYHWKLEIADEILALPLNIPNKEEIEKAAENFEQSASYGFSAKGLISDEFYQGSQWAISEIIKRNK